MCSCQCEGAQEKEPIDIVNLINTLNGLEYEHFLLPIGLSSCLVCSSFMI